VPPEDRLEGFAIVHYPNTRPQKVGFVGGSNQTDIEMKEYRGGEGRSRGWRVSDRRVKGKGRRKILSYID
jgi:hypothetical protein